MVETARLSNVHVFPYVLISLQPTSDKYVDSTLPGDSIIP